MLGILIAIIVIIGLIYLAIIIYQHMLLRNVRLLEQKDKRIQDRSLVEVLNQVKQTKLAGKTLDHFKVYKHRYDKIHNHAFDTVDRLIQNIERDSQSLDFIKTRNEYNKVSKIVNSNSDDIEDIKENLNHLRNIVKSHQKAVATLKRVFDKIHKSLLTKHYLYGPSASQLQSDLTKITKQYDKFVHLTHVGDHHSAEEILQKIYPMTDTLQANMKLMPVLYKNLSTTYPKQISEIEHGYEYMTRSGYRFPEKDIKGAINYVQKKIKKTVALLKGLKVEEIKNNCHQTENMINQLYDTLSKEIDAKRQVDQDVDVVTDYIQHAQQQNYALTNELQHLSENYDLTHGEMEQTNDLGKQLAKVDAIHQKDLDAMADDNVIYSDVLEHQKDAESTLDTIEAKQRQINSSVYDLNKKEEYARKQINHFMLRLHSLEREVNHMNLPGVPKDYISSFNDTYDQVVGLLKNLNQTKISMDDINKRVTKIQTNVEALSDETASLIEAATLSEELMQYANRYRASYKGIASADERAQALFNNEYRYQDSFDLISAALDQVEPGASKRLQQEYENQRQTTNSL